MRSDAIEAIYIHIPFCLRKCHYCDFLSSADTDQMSEYIDALLLEMRMVTERYPIQPCTIFIGGGTPSCLPEPLLEKLLNGIQKYFIQSGLKEYTMEANPGTLTPRKLYLMKKYGVNRVSIGVQSNREEQLKLLGRIHNFDQAKLAVRMAREAGIDNINLDFMYGLPGQTLEQWEETLTAALDLHPEHLSLYQLKIEEGTLLHQWLEAGIIQEFDDELALQMYRAAQKRLQMAGYRQYEISNYSCENYESKHNQVYWKTCNYLGLGLGACSWVRPFRWNNCADINSYCRAIQEGRLPQQEADKLTEREQMEETVFMALRMNQGVSEIEFQQRFHKSLREVFPEAIAQCCNQKLLQATADGYAMTEQGRVLGNLVFMEFVE